jgi:hypothetical protein
VFNKSKPPSVECYETETANKIQNPAASASLLRQIKEDNRRGEKSTRKIWRKERT